MNIIAASWLAYSRSVRLARHGERAKNLGVSVGKGVGKEAGQEPESRYCCARIRTVGYTTLPFENFLNPPLNGVQN